MQRFELLQRKSLSKYVLLLLSMLRKLISRHNKKNDKYNLHLNKTLFIIEITTLLIINSLQIPRDAEASVSEAFPL